jgi:hypothetical protein
VNRIEISDAKSSAASPAYAQIPGTSVTGQLIDPSTTRNRR